MSRCGWRSWRPTSSSLLAVAEQALLRDFLKRPHRLHKVEVPLRVGNAVELSTLQTLHVPGDDPSVPPLLCMHGFGSALGMFTISGSLDRVVERWRGDIYAVDWPGMGASSRTPLLREHMKDLARARSQIRGRRGGTAHQELELVQEATGVFAAAVESWRESVGLQRFALLGHSLGGYLGGQYALAHPDRVTELMLVSPAGLVGAAPAPRHPPEETVRMASPSWPVRLITHMFDNHTTPQSLIRVAGPYGPKLMHGAISRRFPHLDPDVRAHIAEYLFHVTAADGSGEFVLAAVLDMLTETAPGRRGLFAVDPLLPRLSPERLSPERLSPERLSPERLSPEVPVRILFGDHDWMATPYTLEAVRRATDVALAVVPSAGHHLYLDNVPGYVDALFPPNHK